jgi:galactose mutarotase-like enzyme
MERAMKPGAECANIASEALEVEISALGAELAAIRDRRGRDLLWNGDPAVWSGRAPILFPVIGMLRDGRYRFDGGAFEMPKHGFARHSMFEILPGAADAVTMRLDASAATRAIYPFEFRLELTFAVQVSALHVTAAIANRGDGPMPASFGFHPALRWPLPFDHPRAEHLIRFAHPEPAPVRRIDGAGLLTPTPHPTPIVGDRLWLRDELFADDALIFDQLKSRSVRYGAEGGPCIEVSFEDFSTLGVWTRPGAPFICIEPWQGLSDPEGFNGDIRDKPGIMNIPVGETRTLSMGLALLPEDWAYAERDSAA